MPLRPRLARPLLLSPARLAAALVLALGLGAPALAEPKPSPKPGMRWEAGLTAAQERSAREGRPLLVCVNALEDEGANIRLATQLYPSEAWGRSARGFVCVVANPNEHAGSDGLCARYGHAPCRGHQETLAWVLRTFSPDGGLISPQHLILEPDGAVAYRKEYFEGHEGPRLFEAYLTQLAPLAAQRMARADRAERLERLAKVPTKDLLAFAGAWLAEPEDGLAALGVVAALEDATDPTRRLALLEALARTPPAQALGLVPFAEGPTAEPDVAPRETLAWVRALCAAERRLGLWAATRVIARTGQAALRAETLEVVAGAKGAAALQALEPGERAALEEALLLAGAKVPKDLAPADGEGPAAVPLVRRLRARAREVTGAAPLPERLAEMAPGALRAALLAASPEDVRRRGADVEALLRQAPYARVRIAAALALLGAGQGATRQGVGGIVAQTIVEALLDPLEGPETRALAVARLGEDPGEDPEEWRRALDARTGGGK